MGQEQGKAAVRRRRNALKIGAMERRIIDSSDSQFARADRNKRGLIDQQGDLVPIGKFGELRHRHPAVVIMVAERDVDRSDLTQTSQEFEEMRQSFGDIQQVSGDENPIRPKLFNSKDDVLMPRLMPIDVKIAEMDRPAPCKVPADVRELRHFVAIEPDFPMGKESKKTIKRLAQGMSDKGPDSIGPGGDSSDHFMTRSNSTRSCGVTRYPRS